MEFIPSGSTFPGSEYVDPNPDPHQNEVNPQHWDIEQRCTQLVPVLLMLTHVIMGIKPRDLFSLHMCLH